MLSCLKVFLSCIEWIVSSHGGKLVWSHWSGETVVEVQGRSELTYSCKRYFMCDLCHMTSSYQCLLSFYLSHSKQARCCVDNLSGWQNLIVQYNTGVHAHVHVCSISHVHYTYRVAQFLMSGDIPVLKNKQVLIRERVEATTIYHFCAYMFIHVHTYLQYTIAFVRVAYSRWYTLV